MSSATYLEQSCALQVDCSISFGAGCRIAPSFRIPARAGEVSILFGPSGCGKTTTLRLLAGLARPDAGSIRFGDHRWVDTSRGDFCTPQQRKIGMVFQNYALFSHLTVRQNLAFGLRQLKPSVREARIARIADLLEIRPLLDHPVSAISGGQAQRVGLGRSLAIDPCLLLLDEPMAALDEPLRLQLGAELRGLLLRSQRSTIMVTHDLREVERLGDYLLVMDEGRVIEHAPVSELLGSPRLVRTAKILGIDNILSTREAIAAGLIPPGLSSAPFLAIAGEEIRIKETTSAPAARFRLARIERHGPCLNLEFDQPARLHVRMTPQALPDRSLEAGQFYALDIPATARRFLQDSW